MPQQDQPYTFDRTIRAIISIVTVVGVFLLLRYLSDVLIPFAAAVVLAYLLNPTVTFLERKSGSRGVGVLVTLVGLGVVVIVGFTVLVPIMHAQVGRFATSLSKLQTELTPAVSAAGAVSDAAPLDEPMTTQAADAGEGDEAADAEQMTLGWKEFAESWDRFRANAGELSRAERFRQLREDVRGTLVGRILEESIIYLQSENFRKLVLDSLKRAAAGGVTLLNFAVQLVLGLTVIIIVLIYLVFLLLDFRSYARTWHMYLPPGYRATIVDFLKEFDAALRQYLRGQFVVAASVGILCATGFTLIGLPMAIPFGLLVGALNMVPYLQLVAIVPAAFLAIIRAIEANGSILVSLLLVFAVFAIVQVLQDGLLVPRIMGKVTGLRPVAVLLGIFIWGKLLGFLGLLLAIPLTCLGIAYYRRFVLNQSEEEMARAKGA